MLARNFDISVARDGRGFTPLHFLVGSAPDAHARARMLVHDAKIDVNAITQDGSTPLDFAIVRNDVQMLRILAQFGANLERRNTYGLAPLHIVCVKGAAYVPFAIMLLAVGADFRALTSVGESACRRAAGARDAGNLCALVAAGCDLDEPDSDGNTPRQVAVRNGCALPSDADLAATRRWIARTQLDFVRHRAFDVCVALQSLELDALQLCEIMMHSCRAEFVAFHQWWSIAVAVKHFH
jgi:ankyrin repeat protein